MDFIEMLRGLDQQTPEYIRGETFKPGKNPMLERAVYIFQEMEQEKISVKVIIEILRINS